MSDTMTMSEIVGRVSRALLSAQTLRPLGVPSDPEQDWEDASRHQREHAMRIAREVIAAMREPTEAMCEAGLETGVVNNYTFYVLPHHIRTVWVAMIDEALK